jgi:hypothetical protein
MTRTEKDDEDAEVAAEAEEELDEPLEVEIGEDEDWRIDEDDPDEPPEVEEAGSWTRIKMISG